MTAVVRVTLDRAHIERQVLGTVTRVPQRATHLDYEFDDTSTAVRIGRFVHTERWPRSCLAVTVTEGHRLLYSWTRAHIGPP